MDGYFSASSQKDGDDDKGGLTQVPSDSASGEVQDGYTDCPCSRKSVGGPGCGSDAYYSVRRNVVHDFHCS